MQYAISVHATNNVMNQDGYTALMFAAQYGHDAVVTLLLDRGANIDCADKVGSMCLYGKGQWRMCYGGREGGTEGERKRKDRDVFAGNKGSR